METKWCYQCQKDKLLREFDGPKEHKNSLCIKCFDKAMRSKFDHLGFSELEGD